MCKKIFAWQDNPGDSLAVRTMCTYTLLSQSHYSAFDATARRGFQPHFASHADSGKKREYLILRERESTSLLPPTETTRKKGEITFYATTTGLLKTARRLAVKMLRKSSQGQDKASQGPRHPYPSTTTDNSNSSFHLAKEPASRQSWPCRRAIFSFLIIRFS